MKNSSRTVAMPRTRRLTQALLLSSAAGMFLWMVPAGAQELNITADPVTRAIDDVGVDLKSLSPTNKLTQFAIGPKDSPVLSYGLYTNVFSGDTPIYSIESEDCTTEVGVYGCVYESHSFQYGGYSDVFDKMPPVYNHSSIAGFTQKGGVWHSVTDISVNDGTELVFTDGDGGRISTVTRPDGEVLTYHYNSGYLTAIVSSRGYMMKIQGLVSKRGTADVHPSQITLINMATDYCNPDSTSACTGLSQSWPSVTYTMSGSSSTTASNYVWQGSDNSGAVWTETDNMQYASDGSGYIEHTFTKPSGDWYQLHYNFALPAVVPGVAPGYIGSLGSGVLAWVKNSDGTWTYSIDTVSAFTGSDTSTAPDGVKQRYLNGSFIDGNGNTTKLIDNGIAPTYVVLPEGGRIDYTYDNRYNVTKTVKTAKDGTSTITSSAVYPAYTACNTNPKTCNKPTSTTDANGNVTDYTYDSNSGMVATKTYPADGDGVRKVETYSYEQLSAQYKNSSGTLVAFNPIWVLKSKSVCKTSASCSGTSDEIITSYSYDGNLLPVTETISNGAGTVLSATTTSYDAMGNVTSVDGPASGSDDTIYYFYDTRRNQTGTIGPDPDGDGALPRPATYTVYDTDSRPTRTETGTVTGTTSSALSAISVSEYTDYSYDTRGRKILEITYSGAPGSASAISAVQYSYDIRGRVVCTAVRMNPNIYGSLPSDVCTLGTEGSYGPDRITKNTYDNGGRLTQVTRAYGTSLAQTYAAYSYGNDGEKVSVTDASGNKTAFSYDGFNRQTQTSFASASSAGSVNSADYETYGYDNNGNMTSYRKRDGKTFTYSYDGLNQMVKSASPDGSAYDVYYDYDLRGLELSARLGSASGAGVVNSYDDLGRKLTETFNGKTVTYGYDALGNCIKITWPDGYYVSYTYDILGRMKTVTANGSTLLATYAYTSDSNLGSLTFGSGGSSVSYGWSSAGQLTSMVHDFSGTGYDLSTSYGYNPAQQVLSASISNSGFVYGASSAGTTGYSVNGLNQYTALSGLNAEALGYDAKGNLTSDGSFTYGYDAENRLTTAVSSSVTASYGYDPLGRRYQKTVNGTVTSYLSAGDDLIADYDSAGNLTYRYVPGQYPDQPIARITSGGTIEYVHADRQGSVIALANDTGTLSAGPYSYSSFGAGGSLSGVEFQYTGRQIDPETGLYYYRARYYSPTLGRFLQTDPVGYEDDINWYAYVGNDPMNATDPSGLTLVPQDFCVTTVEDGQTTIYCHTAWYDDGLGSATASSGDTLGSQNSSGSQQSCGHCLNVDAFANALDVNVHTDYRDSHNGESKPATKSVGMCGRYVGFALKAGGVHVGSHAGKDYGPYLLKNNFYVVSPNGYTPQKGDVVVYGKSSAHPDGHSEGYDGNRYVSDFMQNGQNPYKKPNTAGSSAIYRSGCTCP